MPRILESVIASLPASLASNEGLVNNVRSLQQEMRKGAPLRLLEATGPFVGADTWNRHLAGHVERGEGWHDAPWWLVENYMYKRLLEEFARCGGEAVFCDPFKPQKEQSLVVAASAFESSIRPLLERVAQVEAGLPDDSNCRSTMEAVLLRSLWGNQADLSLSGGKVETSTGEKGGELITDHVSLALDLLLGAAGRSVVLVLDNHGPEVVCDLVLADALLRIAGVASVVLHVKDAPVFVSDVTESDVHWVIDWIAGCDASFSSRLRSCLSEGRLIVVSNSFYTSALAFWELPDDLRSEFSKAAAVILKGDANYRRLLGDLHWPRDVNFETYARSFWPADGLVSLRTIKSGAAIAISKEKELEAREARPSDWSTSGHYGQVSAYWRRG
eukprot:gnl/TRDRNA2_/TRDRNA2_41597_c0_seq2.p1 gnl/TRDRNA2_/TRDRNA2_41597_c0~~gnl/TRDRNA2_/TRDRNA2_41597_c0_seq2.p1  ORF type:complete len:387 (-),score=63.63 gnl/TRDRNA2_/TRDRNA2_41597_c0_seq2:53-1213(-)